MFKGIIKCAKPIVSKSKILSSLRRKLARDEDVSYSSIMPNTVLSELDYMDDLDFVNLIMYVENKYGIKTTERQAKSLRTVDDLANLIYKKLA